MVGQFCTPVVGQIWMPIDTNLQPSIGDLCGLCISSKFGQGGIDLHGYKAESRTYLVLKATIVKIGRYFFAVITDSYMG